MSTSAFTSYCIQYNGGVEKDFQLVRWNAGTSTILASYAVTTTATTTLTAKLEVSGTGASVALTVTLNGVAQTVVNDTSGSRITSTGTVGIHAYDIQTISTGVVLNSLTADGASVETTIAIDDAALFFSPYNWRYSGSTYAQSANPGAYLKFRFTGTSLKITVDGTPLSGASIAAGNWPKIAYSIDGGAYTTAQITDGDMVLASGLSAGTHTVRIVLKSTRQADDRWTTPTNLLRITGLKIDDGASVSAPDIAANRMLFFGDSITEGVYVLSAVSDMASNDATALWLKDVADSFSAEYGAVGWGSQGWTTTGAANVPTFPNAWDFISSGQSRLSGGVFSPAPEKVMVVHGANDGLQGASDASVTAAVTAFLTDLRAAAPTSKIFIVIPFGGYKRSAITTGFNNYGPDADAFLLDLGAPGEAIIAANSTDGVHANQTAQPLLGDALIDLMPSVTFILRATATGATSVDSTAFVVLS